MTQVTKVAKVVIKVTKVVIKVVTKSTHGQTENSTVIIMTRIYGTGYETKNQYCNDAHNVKRA